MASSAALSTSQNLAANGLLYNNMHTTALCSPTRSCILTGRNHHSNHMAAITEASTGYPGYDGNIPHENGFLSEMLLQHGYNTYAVGKWHLTPADQISAAGSYNRWPLGRGFERYYGFLGGDTHQYYPDLTYDNHRVEPPKTPEEGYHLTEDITDKAISFIADSKQVAPNKPFFLYYATGAMHAPHHVPKVWADKYKGVFDDGWEAYRKNVFNRQKELGVAPADAELSRQDPDVKPWDQCSPDERKLYARMMEVFAGFLTHTDHQIGRLLDFLKEIDEFENTLIMVLSDNGASSEGGPEGSVNENLFFNFVPESLEENLAALEELGGPKYFNHYAWGWTWAGNTPFRRWKRETYRGGVSDACMVFWPEGIKASGELRTQYAHAVDLVPTVLEALDIKAPEMIRGVPQSPIQGLSFAHSFDNAAVETKHHTQYFEMFGHRSLYHDGWKAVCPFPGPNFTEAAQKERYFGMPLTTELLNDLDAHGWELYNVVDDPAETKNLAAEMPDKVQEMAQRWYAEAGKYGALPLASAELARMNVPRPTVSRPRQKFVYYPGGAPISFSAAPKLYNRPHSITADVVIPDEGAEGMLMTHGSRNAGYALFVKDGHLHYIHNYVGLEKFEVISSEPVPTGEVSLRYEFEPTGEPRFREGKGSPGRLQLYINEELVGNLEVPYSTPQLFGVLGASCGYAAFDSVNPEVYQAPFRFSGEIKQVVIDVSGELLQDDEAELKRLMTQQ
jgi:arylsulfatase A-like enzyme